MIVGGAGSFEIRPWTDGESESHHLWSAQEGLEEPGSGGMWSNKQHGACDEEASGSSEGPDQAQQGGICHAEALGSRAWLDPACRRNVLQGL